MNWKKAFGLNKTIILSTVCKDLSPHANCVFSEGFVDNKLLIGNCQMDTTFKNLQRDNRVCIISLNDKGYFRIKGKATIYPSGKYFDLALKRSKPPLPKSALVIDIQEVFDLDKAQKIF